MLVKRWWAFSYQIQSDVHLDFSVEPFEHLLYAVLLWLRAQTRAGCRVQGPAVPLVGLQSWLVNGASLASVSSSVKWDDPACRDCQRGADPFKPANTQEGGTHVYTFISHFIERACSRA